MQWLTLPGHAPATPQRPSQIMHESTAPDELEQHCSRTKMLLPALGMQAGSEMRSGKDGRTQMQRTIGNVR